MGGPWVLVMVFCSGPVCGELIVVREWATLSQCQTDMDRETERRGPGAFDFLLGCLPVDGQ